MPPSKDKYTTLAAHTIYTCRPWMMTDGKMELYSTTKWTSSIVLFLRNTLLLLTHNEWGWNACIVPESLNSHRIQFPNHIAEDMIANLVHLSKLLRCRHSACLCQSEIYHSLNSFRHSCERSQQQMQERAPAIYIWHNTLGFSFDPHSIRTWKLLGTVLPVPSRLYYVQQVEVPVPLGSVRKYV